MLSLGSDGITWVFDWIAWDCSKFRGFWLSFITVSLAIFINNNYNISSNLQREEQLNRGYIAMKINPSKTKELRVCFSFQSPSYAPIIVSDRVMLLGVVISSDLKWNSHIDYIIRKLLSACMVCAFSKETPYLLMFFFLLTARIYDLLYNIHASRGIWIFLCIWVTRSRMSKREHSELYLQLWSVLMPCRG